jgi:hypothetical protein
VIPLARRYGRLALRALRAIAMWPIVITAVIIVPLLVLAWWRVRRG